MEQTKSRALAGFISIDPQASGTWWLARVREPAPVFPFRQVDNAESFAKAVAEMKAAGVRRIFVDTPGTLADEELLLVALQHADDVVVPIQAEPLVLSATVRTMKRVVVPSGLPYKIVINNIDPRDGDADLESTRAWADKHGWVRANTFVRRYKIHANMSANATLITRLQNNRIASNARTDITELALELGYGNHDDPEPKITAVANQKGGVGKTTVAVHLTAQVNKVLGGGA